MQNFFNKFKPTTTRPIHFTLGMGIACLLFPACGTKDGGCDDRIGKTIRVGIPEAIPYQNGQTIRYKTNEGDSFSVKTARKFEVLQSDAYCEEYLEVILTDPKNTYPFVESIQRGLATDSMIHLSVSPRRKNGTGTSVQLYLTKDQKLSGFNTGNYQYTLLPTTNINGKQYKEVIKLDYNLPDNAESISQFFYNKAFGILQCRTKGGFVVTIAD